MKLILTIAVFILLHSALYSASMLKFRKSDDSNDSRSSTPLSFLSGSSASTDDPLIGEKPKDNYVIGAFKQTKGRRKCTLIKSPNIVWDSLKGLRSDKSYIIKMYRETSGYRDIEVDFPRSPEKFDFKGSNAFRNLIQTFHDEDPSKRLCIFTQNDIKNLVALEAFTKNMIRFENNNEEKDKIFRFYKQKLGLPSFFSTFRYVVYAWITDSDCSFYNLGQPKLVIVPESESPSGNQSLAPSESYSETPLWNENVFAVQFSNPIYKKFSNLEYKNQNVTIMQVTKSSDSICRLRANRFAANYYSMSDLFGDISGQVVETFTLGTDKCGALFMDGTQAPDASRLANFFNDAINEYSTVSAVSVKILMSADQMLYDDLFELAPGSKVVSFASWNSYDGECVFPMEFHQQFIQPKDSSVSETKTTEIDSDDEF